MSSGSLLRRVWRSRRAVTTAVIATAALLVVLQASAGNATNERVRRAAAAPLLPGKAHPRLQRPARQESAKGLAGPLQGVARTQRLSGTIAAAQAARAEGIDVTASGARVIVVARDDVTAARNAVSDHGGSVERNAGALVQALVPLSDLTALAADPAVALVRKPLTATPDAISTGEEIAALNAPGYTASGFDGTGVKIGIIDLGFAGYASLLGTELPASVTTQDFCGGGLTTATEHGTAVAEIVHEVAPGAQLYLICFNTEVDLASAEAYAKAQGIKIINHSVSWFDTWRGDGNGPAGTPDATVKDARNNGILWVNAAGNQGQNHWNGTYVDDGCGFAVFNPADPSFGDLDQIVIGGGQQACVFLKWDSWPTTHNDYDLAALQHGGLQ